MGSEVKYVVQSTGGVLPGFREPDAIRAFASTFGVSAETAGEYFGGAKKIQHGLSESDALRYQKKLLQLGLEVSIIPETTDAPAPQMVCPKCLVLQPRTDTCRECGLITSKYRARAEQTAETAIPATGSRKQSLTTARCVTRKYLPAAAAFMVVAIIGFGFYSDNTKQPEEPQDTFTQAALARDSIGQLIIAAGLDDLADPMNKEFAQLYEAQFPAAVDRYNGDVGQIEHINKMLPAAYNPKGAMIGVANWLDVEFDDHEIEALMEIFESPVVKKASQLSPDADEEAYDQFVSDYELNPPKPDRLKALEHLLEITAMERAALMLFEQGQASLDTVAAATSRDPDSSTVRREREAHLASIGMMMMFVESHTSELAMQGMAWDFQHFSLTELQDLARELDDPLTRKFYRTYINGLEDYLIEATDWLAQQVRLKKMNHGV